MSGFDNEVVVAIGMRLEPSTAQSVSIMQKTTNAVSRVNWNGNPEGVVSANPSSLCHDPITGNFYLKQSGTGNTGWVQLTPASGGSGGVNSWVNSTSGPVNITPNIGYFSNDPASNLTFNLPAVAAVGSVIRITNRQASFNFTIAQASGQSVQFGDKVTTVGTGGSISSIAIGDSIELVCVVANTTWQVLSSQGNLTVV